MTKKTVSESAVTMRQLVMPNDANPHNTIFGGVVMSWVDMAAAMVGERHTNGNVVTVHIDDITFLSPIRVGDHVLIQAQLNYVGRSSMLIGVKVTAENPMTGDLRHTTSAYLTFVGLNDVGRPTEIPGLEISTDEEKRRFAEGKARVDAQKVARDKQRKAKK